MTLYDQTNQMKEPIELCCNIFLPENKMKMKWRNDLSALDFN